MTNSPSRQHFFYGLLTLIVLASMAANSLLAQQPWPYKKTRSAVLDPRKVNELRRSKRQAVGPGSAATKEQRDALSKFYVSHVFSGMTQPAALDDAMQFPNWRKELVMDLEKLRDNPDLYRYLRDDLCLRYLPRLVTDNYHPACRYNAALMIGMLNDQEGERNTSTPFPVPSAKGREFLIRVVGTKSMPEAVRIAALIGLRRHAELLAAAGSSDAKMIPPLVDVIKANVDATSSDAEAANWEKRLAIETLGAIGFSGAAPILSPVVNDEKMPLSVRCAAVRALGQLDYRNANNIDVSSMLKGFGAVAVSACRNEIQRAQQFNEEHPEPAQPTQTIFTQQQDEPTADPMVMQIRRQLKHRLNCVSEGLSGVEKLATQPEQQNMVTTIRSQINAIQQGLDEGVETMTVPDLLNKIGPPAGQLENLVKGNQ